MNSFDGALSSGRLSGFFCWAKVYVRFFRWASDRIDENGILAFVSNSWFIDGKTFDGFRHVVANYFNEIWIVVLKGMPGQAAIAAAAKAEMFSMTEFELVSRSIYVSRSEDRKAAAFATRQCVTMLSPMKNVNSYNRG
jgi:hypothetical protein